MCKIIAEIPVQQVLRDVNTEMGLAALGRKIYFPFKFRIEENGTDPVGIGDPVL